MNSLLFTFLVAMTPVIELRGAIPLAVARGALPQACRLYRAPRG